MATDIAARRTARSRPGGNPERRRNERELVMLFQREPAARDRVVRALLPLAQGIAQKYRRGEEPIEDLEQVATVGLLKALKAFDPSRGTSFAAYAIPTMSGELRRHYRDTGWAVHVPRGTQELALKVNKADQQASASAGRHPTAAELAERFDCDVEAIVEARIASRAMRTGSLDKPAHDDQGESEPLGNTLGAVPDPGFERAEARATIGHLTASLSERDRRVLALRFQGDLSQSEIGREVGVSQMQVSRILRRVLNELQDAAAH